MVTKLDRLARSLPDARHDRRRTHRPGVSVLVSAASVYDPNDPVGRLLFNVLAMVAEFEVRPDSAPYLSPAFSSEGRGVATRLLRCLTDIPHVARDVG